MGPKNAVKKAKVAPTALNKRESVRDFE